MRKVVIIGGGKMAHDCLARTTARGDVKVPLVITRVMDDSPSRRLVKLCEIHSIDLVDSADPNSDSVLGRIRAVNPDAIFNINGFSILKSELISLPRLGVINFHNGLLPSYAGLNIPTWVIWNGETEHGVTWHYIDDGIDTGDVIAQSTFAVEEGETVATLTMKCILQGISMFEDVLEEVLFGQPSRQQQHGERTYYRASDIPNDGFIDFDWPPATVARLLRALDFRPFPNTLAYPRIRWTDSYISIRVATVLEESGAATRGLPGTIAEISTHGIVFWINGGRLIARSFARRDGKAMDVAQAVKKYGLSTGMRLG